MTTDFLAVPRATDDPVEHADWMELRAIEGEDGNASFQDLVREISRSGTTDAMGDPEALDYRGDVGEEQSQQVAEDAISEIQDRIDCSSGDLSVYPFELDGTGQLLKVCSETIDESLYLFLLLLSKIDLSKEKKQAGVDATELFEEICAEALRVYFGGHNPNVGIRLFGSPRRKSPPGFADALDELCRAMGEGTRHRGRPTLKDQRDAKLDLAVWRDFRDGRRGKLIGFAQCKAGKHWRRHLTDLVPENFCAKWILDRPVVLPTGIFFVPLRVARRVWDVTCIDAGILFDRCRITECGSQINSGVADKWRRWSARVVKRKIKARRERR